MSLFEKATRKKLRFDSKVGALSVEQVWELPLTSPKGNPNLDDLARDLHRQLNNGDNVSFVHAERMSDADVQLKFDVVRYIIDVRMAENKAKNEEQEKASKKQLYMSVLADREMEDLKKLSPEEIRQKMAELG